MTETHNKNDTAEVVQERGRTGTDEPSLYKVLLHNDNYTSMDFVVIILEKVFGKSTAQATRVMLQVHHDGVGVAGVYTREIAETKISLVHDLARKNEFPLKCTLEKA